jgi:hypothetical protein
MLERTFVGQKVTLVLARSFEIHIRGHLPADVLEEFEGLTATVVPAATVLSGTVPDQAALYGVLDRLQSLGLELVELRRLSETAAE